jgi:hypothetical protein
LTDERGAGLLELHDSLKRGLRLRELSRRSFQVAAQQQRGSVIGLVVQDVRYERTPCVGLTEPEQRGRKIGAHVGGVGGCPQRGPVDLDGAVGLAETTKGGALKNGDLGRIAGAPR